MNIGDIAHTPGALRMLERDLPEARVILWSGPAGRLQHGARDLLLRNFPRLQIVEGELDDQGRPRDAALVRAWTEADCLLHGSGASLLAAREAEHWSLSTGKPWGVWGITWDPLSGVEPGRRPDGATLAQLGSTLSQLPPSHLAPSARALLNSAAFVFCRESLSLAYLRAQGVEPPILEFGPDATFSLELRDDPAANRILQTNDLTGRPFVCVVPRLRYTPYQQIQGRDRRPSDDVRDAVNARTAEPDLHLLRDTIVQLLESDPSLRIVICPEMTYQVELGRRLFSLLPPSTRSRTSALNRYWLPDEAASLYRQASAVLSVECHSPIMALTQGTPAIYIRQPTDTLKGQMYSDLGIGDWAPEIEESTPASIAEKIGYFLTQASAARARATDARQRAVARHRRMAHCLRATIGLPSVP